MCDSQSQSLGLGRQSVQSGGGGCGWVNRGSWVVVRGFYTRELQRVFACFVFVVVVVCFLLVVVVVFGVLCLSAANCGQIVGCVVCCVVVVVICAPCECVGNLADFTTGFL
jgi:hypothetical protein